MSIEPLRAFVIAMTDLVDRTAAESECIAETRRFLSELIATDTWLPDFCAIPDPERYQQYLLHCDPRERFSVVSFVWGPGQSTPIHDHTVWGLIGVLRGAETSRRFVREGDGRLSVTGEERCEVGSIEVVSPSFGDIHEVANALSDRSSVSIHVYGANIGAVHRHAFDPGSGASKTFVSGYSSAQIPNLWDRSSAANSRDPAA